MGTRTMAIASSCKSLFDARCVLLCERGCSRKGRKMGFGRYFRKECSVRDSRLHTQPPLIPTHHPPHLHRARALPLSFLYHRAILTFHLVRQHLHEPLEVLLAQLPAKERLDIEPISRLLIDACAGLRLEERLLREH